MPSQSTEIPKGYRPPRWREVEPLLKQLKAERRRRIDQIKALKKARRNEWNDTVQKLPAAFRNLPIVVGDASIPEMIARITGIVAKGDPSFEVLPPSGRMADVHKAAQEEKRLQALFMGIQDQQDRDVFRMGVDAQCAWGESWISVWEDGSYFDDRYKRQESEEGEVEDAADYVKRYRKMMLEDGIPIILEDHDPQTVFPLYGKRQRLEKVLIESEHPIYEIQDVFGYESKIQPGGERAEWSKKMLGDADVPQESRSGSSGDVDITHDLGFTITGDSEPSAKTVKRVVYMDPWCTVVFLDGEKVEQRIHGYGRVNIWPAYGKTTSDRDPAWATQGIADAALVIARQMVLFSAALASNAYLHGFPTGFIRNPSAGVLDPKTQMPTARPIRLAELNILGPNEEIEFPFLAAHMGPDFNSALDMLSGKLDSLTLGAFNRALDSEAAGYAIAQVRSMQLSVLSTVYSSLTRQLKGIAYFLRYLVKTRLKGGVTLPGAVEENEDGEQFRPVLDYSPEDCTDFPIEVHIPEGVSQDQMAERKSALELHQAGIWSKRRTMEETGVDDPAAEQEEISTTRMLDSPMADQIVLTLAQQLIAERTMAVTQATNTPFAQQLEAAKQQVLGNGAGMPINQGAGPMNALPGGQPMQQNPAPDTPLAGGPMTGPTGGDTSMAAAGVPQIPGGVKGGQPLPAGAG